MTDTVAYRFPKRRYRGKGAKRGTTIGGEAVQLEVLKSDSEYTRARVVSEGPRKGKVLTFQTQHFNQLKAVGAELNEVERLKAENEALKAALAGSGKVDLTVKEPAEEPAAATGDDIVIE